MTTPEQKIQDWIILETNVLSEGGIHKIPALTSLHRLTEGKNKKIWKYLTTHVRSQASVQKVRRILKVKRDQNNPEKYLCPLSIDKLADIRQEKSKANERRRFLENFVSTLKQEIVSIENDVRNIRDETSKVQQKTAILQLKTMQYQEKTAMLISLHKQLSSHLKNRNSRQNTKCNFPANVQNNVEKSCLNICDDIPLKIKYLLPRMASLVLKKLSNSPDINVLTFKMKESFDQAFINVPISDLLFILKEMSKQCYIHLIKMKANNQKQAIKCASSPQKRESEKLLQDMELEYISYTFYVKKAKNDIHQLNAEKQTLLASKFNLISIDSEYQNKCQLLHKIAENEGLSESIQHLEEELSKQQAEANQLEEVNAMEAISSDDIEATQIKFYNNFDTICSLQKSSPEVLKYIRNFFFQIRRFANTELFSNVTSTHKEYPRELERNLRYETETMWNVLNKKNVIKPLLQEPMSLEQPVPNDLLAWIHMEPFQNLTEVCQNVKSLKDFVSSKQKFEMEFDEERSSKVLCQYDLLIDMLHRMQTELNVCDEELGLGLGLREPLQIALHEWWNQSAQYIPNIEYENKTLKMWLDILLGVKELE